MLGDSDLSSSALWGDEGDLSSGDLPPVLADTIFGLEPGEVSEVVAADYGFHIFQVVERLPPEQMELARAEERIREILRRELVDDGLEKLVVEARERYNVQVFPAQYPLQLRRRLLGLGPETIMKLTLKTSPLLIAAVLACQPWLLATPTASCCVSTTGLLLPTTIRCGGPRVSELCAMHPI